MAIKFRLVAKKDMRKGADKDAKVYGPVIVSGSKVTLGQLCEEVAEQSSLTTGDVKNALDRLVFCIQSHLKNGQGVDAGDLGHFSIVLRSGSAESEEAYDTKLMRTPKVLFYPGKKLRDMQGDIRYERVKTASAGSGEDEDDLPQEVV